MLTGIINRLDPESRRRTCPATVVSFQRITIACTGVAAAHFSLCLHVKSRHLGDAYRYPTEMPMTLIGD
ncbi:hypothetical protein, partial [Rubripirellula obstinata]|uniref:hypothetical protein n=1 Tax=Rubripirellula obstinata TaxID=406547 RepID=UPI00138FA260